ncbi:SWIM zinc finger family protein [Bacillus benzoevorans]|uniref:Putative Zn finger protein n=2 Tax=Bacillus benzoevorans TaxID=1456 RepID=A0A7X0HVW1_9BACI|nr:putative Zn finger protein [Bacillus benzoevorans]
MKNETIEEEQMNINNFKNHVDEVILDRGHDYYIDGKIVDSYEQGNNEYVFSIEGREYYEVIVKIDENGEILSSFCDCPYDFGLICKHEVAAYYELFDMLKHASQDNKSKQEIQRQPTLHEVLEKRSKEELISIIEDIATNDPIFKNTITFKYAQGDPAKELEMCRRLIDSIVRKHTGRKRFIPYGKTDDFIDDMGEVLEKARISSDPLLSVDIAFLVLEEALEAYQYTDDSDGDIEFLINETINLIEEMVMESNDSDLSQREQLFNKLLEQSDSEIFDEWEELRIDLLRICVEFADIVAFRNTLRKKIETEIEISQYSGNKYSHEGMLHLLYEMIDMYGTKEEAEQFLNDHLMLSSFRERLINRYISDKKYDTVIELALEGEKQDQPSAGLVSKWKKIRFKAYKELSLIDEQKKLAKELLLQGDFEYYQELKAFVTGDRGEFYQRLKRELKNGNSWQASSVYLRLIEGENDLDEILVYVRENPISIEKYAERLVSHFRDEVVEIYSAYIKSAANASSSRKDYQRVCNMLQRYKKIAGPKNQEDMIIELSELYYRRPAFRDELSKLK